MARFLGWILLCAFGGFSAQLVAQTAEPFEITDACIACHQGLTPQVMQLFHTPHGLRSDEQSPMAQQQCQTCHGDIQPHISNNPEQVKPEITFTQGTETPVSKRDGVCLSCHSDTQRQHWAFGQHQQNGVACTDCHTIHATTDPVMTRRGETRVCTDCHKDIGHSMRKLSAHTNPRANVRCSSCHQPHGSLTEGMLSTTSVNNACYQCHAETRGPFLWEHAPVRESCLNCHDPHGSSRPAMLTSRVPFLCTQCHSTAGHPSLELTADSLQAGQFNNRFVLIKGCLNCHAAVHGSNHPSGVKLNR